MSRTVTEDFRTMDPVAYLRSLGLQPEDSYGFVPTKEGWPRKALVMKETGPELAESIKEKISKFGYEPEDSFGFCPNFEHNRMYFGWRKR